MTNTAELLPAITSTEVVEFREFEKNLSEYKYRYEGVIYDITVPEQDKQARSDKLAIGKVIAKLDSAHKDRATGYSISSVERAWYRWYGIGLFEFKHGLGIQNDVDDICVADIV